MEFPHSVRKPGSRIYRPHTNTPIFGHPTVFPCKTKFDDSAREEFSAKDPWCQHGPTYTLSLDFLQYLYEEHGEKDETHCSLRTPSFVYIHLHLPLLITAVQFQDAGTTQLRW